MNEPEAVNIDIDCEKLIHAIWKAMFPDDERFAGNSCGLTRHSSGRPPAAVVLQRCVCRKRPFWATLWFVRSDFGSIYIR